MDYLNDGKHRAYRRGESRIRRRPSQRCQNYVSWSLGDAAAGSHPIRSRNEPAGHRAIPDRHTICLRTLAPWGHDARPVGIKTDLTFCPRIADFRPQICFNLVEDFDGIPSRDQHVVSYLELMNQPYTGSNPRGLTLARDKAITKKILSYHGILTPQFAVFPAGTAVRRPRSLQFPLLVKSLTQEGSVGISQSSVVYTDRELLDRVAFLHEKHTTDAIVEQYIEGRELYVAVIGNRKLQTFPIWELCLQNLPVDSARIATAKVKWDEQYRLRHGIASRAAHDLPETLSDQIAELGKDIYRTLGLSGYARIDLRLTLGGRSLSFRSQPQPADRSWRRFRRFRGSGGSFLRRVAPANSYAGALLSNPANRRVKSRDS